MEEAVDEVVKQFHIRMDHIPTRQYYNKELPYHVSGHSKLPWRSKDKPSKSKLDEVINTLRICDDD